MLTIYDILRLGVKLGIKSDLRPKNEVFKYYWQDIVRNGDDSFINPYADSGAVHITDFSKRVSVVAMGIDIGQDEVLTLAKWEEKTKKRVDLFISHHPRGRPAVTFPHILKIQLGNLAANGVSVKSLERLYDIQMKELNFEVLSSNFVRTYGTVELLRRDYISLHSPLDNAAIRFVEGAFARSRANTLGDAVSVLKGIPEYKIVEDNFSLRPEILIGKENTKIGKIIFTEFTGGEEGPLAVYRAMKRAKIDTLLVMHISSEGEKMARKLNLNVVTAGHVASDSIGMNVFSDELEKAGIEIVPIGGFVRVRRSS